MSDDDIRKLLSLEAQATPGPWAIKEDSCNGEDEYYGYWHDVGPLSMHGKCADENDRFVEAARDAVRPLCEEVLQLRAEIAALKASQGMWHTAGPGAVELLPDDVAKDILTTRDVIATLRAERDAAVAEAVRVERERARAMNRWMRGLDKAIEDDSRRGE